MKAFVPVLAYLALAAAGGDKEHMMMKKWAWGKAMESCIGEENFKYIMKEYKHHAAECKGVDAPELELPFFNTPFRTTSSLINGAMSEGNNGFTQQLFNNFVREQLMDKFNAGAAGQRNAMMDDGMPFRKTNGYRGRYRREEPTDALDLGDRLIEKLAGVKEHMQNEIGNFTCKLQKCGQIDENMELQIDNIVGFFDKLPQPLDPWLKARMVGDKKKCYEFAESIPESFYENCAYGPKLGKVKMFKKCCKMTGAKTCMAYDIRTNLDENFGDVEDLIEESNLEENELYSLVQALMMDMDM